MPTAYSPLTALAALAAVSASSPAHADESEPKTRTIIVSGSGEASRAPDVAHLTIGVDAPAKTASDAVRAMSARLEATISRLKASGVAKKDMQTAQLSISPRYNYETRPETPEIIGYTASSSLSVTLRDLDKAGALIDAAVADGANRLGGLSFGFTDPQPLELDARDAAVADARAKAERLAKAAGVSLGPVLQIRDGAQGRSPEPVVFAARAARASNDVPIETGESTVGASVTVVFAIE